MLDGLCDEKLTLQVCESVLEQCTDAQTTLFVLHYMLSRLGHCIHEAKTHDHCNRLLGTKVHSFLLGHTSYATIITLLNPLSLNSFLNPSTPPLLTPLSPLPSPSPPLPLCVQALLCLPTPVRKDYESLVSEPMLLVEQLLIDMKVW